MGEIAHSKIGASSMERWQNCPASVRLSEGMPNKSSIFAEEGTKAHDVAAAMLLDQPFEALDEEYMDAVLVYVEYVQELWKSLPRHDRSKLMIEHRFDLSAIHPGLFGTADAVIYSGADNKLYVIDFKAGSGKPVSPVNNPQLMYYGLGALMSLNIPAHEVELVIVQPRYSAEDAIKSFKLGSMEMLEFAGDLAEFAARTEDPDAITAMGEWCQFCRAKSVCPALKEVAKLAAKEEFAVDNLSNLDPEIVSGLLSKLDLIDTWVKGVREFAYLEAKHGRPPPGYKLVPKRATRKWADPEVALKKLERSLQSTILMDCMTQPTLKSPAQIEKIVGKDAKSLLDGLVVQISSGDTLVKDSDDRPAVKRGALADFADA